MGLAKHAVMYFHKLAMKNWSFNVKRDLIYDNSIKHEVALNVTKHMWDLYDENYKTLMKLITEFLSKYMVYWYR